MKRTPFFTRPSCPNTSRKRPTCWRTSFGPPCGKRTSKPRNRSSSTRSSATRCSPVGSTYDNARRIHFGDHPLGNSILGTTESIKALTCEQMRAYFTKRYVGAQHPGRRGGEFRMAPPGRTGREDLCQLAHRQGRAPEPHRSEGSGRAPRDYEAQGESVRAVRPDDRAGAGRRFAFARCGRTADDGDRRLHRQPALLGADRSGAGRRGRQWRGRKRRGGAYFTSFNCDPENAVECFGLVREILEDVQKTNITADELEQARTKIVSREVRASERTHRRMLTLAKDWAYLKQYRTLDDELAAWDWVKLSTIRELLDRYPITEGTTTTLGPLTASSEG